jgi:hypothetical protein
MQAMAIHDVRGAPVAHLPISYPEHFSGTSVVGNGLRTISLLLNAQSLITGVLLAPTDLYLEGIKRIVDWCRVNGVHLKIRSRPGHRMIAPLKVYAGVEPNSLARNLNETLEEHARDCDLCVMYDMPTMGALVFLRNSIPVLNPVVTPPAAGFLANAHPSVVVTESLDATLERLQGFVAAPLTLSKFREAQFRAYLALFQNTLPLRAYIGLRRGSEKGKAPAALSVESAA